MPASLETTSLLLSFGFVWVLSLLLWLLLLLLWLLLLLLWLLLLLLWLLLLSVAGAGSSLSITTSGKSDFKESMELQ
ncbi:hypothetical protein [Piscirickettsia litoralis]|uniref:hypothetical protein n=1 Tax=Piscirickettsia litoralis TaxID=1891921 RepID=UPI00130190AB|nr:hypothetical protein [Piscirickettsia litoralis]